MEYPDIGTLNHHIELYRVNHTPSGDYSLDSEEELITTVWAKFDVIGGSIYYDNVNTDNAITHRFTFRAVKGLTRPIDLNNLIKVVCDGMTFTVKRVTDLANEGRFTVVDCEHITNNTGAV